MLTYNTNSNTGPVCGGRALSSNTLIQGGGFGFTFNGGSPIMNLMSSSMGGGTLALTPTVYYVHNLTDGKFEPSLSYYLTKYTETSYDDVTSTETSSSTVFGIGYLKDMSKTETYGTYWGGRFSITVISDEDDSIYSIGPVYGAEYNFSDNFSIGGETRLNYAFDTSDEETSVIDISAHLFFRFYN